MAVQLAVKTLNAIQQQMESDQGAAFRVNSGLVLPHMADAYRGNEDGFRSHLGASVIGKTCGRDIWYGWRWFRKPKFPARILRLFNRGHLEEARFIAMFLSIGVQVYQQDSNGRQFRISDLGGHLGGSGDGIAVGIPDLPLNTSCLLEFKTHGEKSFIKLQKEGVRKAKHEHYVQMQMYMRKMNLTVALYGAVNKNTDEIYMEIITLDTHTADEYLQRGRIIIMLKKVPDRIPHAAPTYYDCTYCDHNGICFGKEVHERNCRTCMYSDPREDGTWHCESKRRQLAMTFNDCDPGDKDPQETYQLSKERQLKGCKTHYVPL